MYVSKRNVIVAILLSIVSCGLYTIYWMAMMANEMNAIEENPYGTSGGAVLLFTFFTCGLYGIYYVYKLSLRIFNTFKRYNYYSSDNSIINVLLYCLSYFIPGAYLVSFAIIQNDLNHLIEIKYGNKTF